MRFLLIEDDEFSRKLISRRLTADFAGRAEVEITAYLKDAEKTLDEKRIDLIFLDVHLPDSDYLSILGFIEKYKEVPILLMTSEMNESYIEQCLKMGAVQYLPKDFESLANLKTVVEKWVKTC